MLLAFYVFHAHHLSLFDHHAASHVGEENGVDGFDQEHQGRHPSNDSPRSRAQRLIDDLRAEQRQEDARRQQQDDDSVVARLDSLLPNKERTKRKVGGQRTEHHGKEPTSAISLNSEFESFKSSFLDRQQRRHLLSVMEKRSLSLNFESLPLQIDSDEIDLSEGDQPTGQNAHRNHSTSVETNTFAIVLACRKYRIEGEEDDVHHSAAIHQLRMLPCIEQIVQILRLKMVQETTTQQQGTIGKVVLVLNTLAKPPIAASQSKSIRTLLDSIQKALLARLAVHDKQSLFSEDAFDLVLNPVSLENPHDSALFSMYNAGVEELIKRQRSAGPTEADKNEKKSESPSAFSHVVFLTGDSHFLDSHNLKTLLLTHCRQQQRGDDHQRRKSPSHEVAVVHPTVVDRRSLNIIDVGIEVGLCRGKDSDLGGFKPCLNRRGAGVQVKTGAAPHDRNSSFSPPTEVEIRFAGQNQTIAPFTLGGQERTVVAGSMYAMSINLHSFLSVGGFIPIGTSESFPDRVNRGKMEVKKTQVVLLLQVQYSIHSVEVVMESVELGDIRSKASGASMQAQVRSTYALVVEATTLWESLTKKALDKAPAIPVGLLSQFQEEEKEALSFIEEGDSKKEEVIHSGGGKILQKMKALSQRLGTIVKQLRALANVKEMTSCEELPGWYLSLRLAALDQQTIVTTDSISWFKEEDYMPVVSRYYANNSMSAFYPSYTLPSLMARWKDALLRKHPFFGAASSNALTTTIAPSSTLSTIPGKVHVVWDGFCCNCCGFSTEIQHFLVPLQRRGKVAVHTTLASTCFCQGSPAFIEESLLGMHLPSLNHYAKMRVDQPPKGHDVLVWIEHTDPLQWSLKGVERRRPNYFIGRSMYEFSRVGQNWVDASKVADEIWVPGEFVRSMFEESGFPKEKLVVIPEAVDSEFYHPNLVVKYNRSIPALREEEDSWRQWCNFNRSAGLPTSDAGYTREPYKFFSNFKWEPRKGWKYLFRAYIASFHNVSVFHGRVELHILTYRFVPGLAKYDKHNVSAIVEELGIFLEEEYFSNPNSSYSLFGKTIQDIPPFCLITEMLSETQMRNWYGSMDAFVLPTQGEGWGLPAIQAMSLGLPTIATNWGGTTEFMTNENSFLIDLDGLEEVPMDSLYGWQPGKKWAVPSVDHLSQILVAIENDPRYGVEVGRRARNDIVSKFSEDAVAEIVEARLEQIRLKVHRQRSEKKKKRQQEG